MLSPPASECRTQISTFALGMPHFNVHNWPATEFSFARNTHCPALETGKVLSQPCENLVQLAKPA